jgi:hypothetical protein
MIVGAQKRKANDYLSEEEGDNEEEEPSDNESGEDDHEDSEDSMMLVKELRAVEKSKKPKP